MAEVTMGRLLAILVLACGCATGAPPLPGDDVGTFDAGYVVPVVDAGHDSGHDAGAVDAGVDSGPPCACPPGPCCDNACAPLPTSTLCDEDFAETPNTCYSLGTIGGVPRYGYGSPRTRTYCGASGACDGTVVMDDYYHTCPVFKTCRIQAEDGQAICAN